MTTTADELKAAATRMRSFQGPAAEPIAELLESLADHHTARKFRDLVEGPDGPVWEDGEYCGSCGNADKPQWPCEQLQYALAVARAINGGQP